MCVLLFFKTSKIQSRSFRSEVVFGFNVSCFTVQYTFLDFSDFTEMLMKSIPEFSVTTWMCFGQDIILPRWQNLPSCVVKNCRKIFVVFSPRRRHSRMLSQRTCFFIGFHTHISSIKSTFNLHMHKYSSSHHWYLLTNSHAHSSYFAYFVTLEPQVLFNNGLLQTALENI